MSWTYHIATGRMVGVAGESFQGYSGAGHTAAEGRNNPAMVEVQAKGPIPPGVYTIGQPHLSPHTGPFTMDLEPAADTNTFGRSLFRIHGNNQENDASHGCIILPPAARHAIWDSGDHTVVVTP